MGESVMCSIRFGTGQSYPFLVEPRCAVGKLKDALRDNGDFDVTRIELESDKFSTPLILTDDAQCLIEDYKVSATTCIVLCGTDNLVHVN